MDSNLKLSTSQESVLLDKIHASYLRNNANLFEILKEVKLPEEYVTRAIKKFQKRDKGEVSRIIADEIMQHLILGYRSRVQHLRDIIGSLKAYEVFMKSTCCTSRVRKLDLPLIKEDGTQQEQYECLGCNQITDFYLELPKDTLALKLQALDELRKEDADLIKVCEKMGYTNKEKNTPPVVVNQQNNFVSFEGNIGADRIEELEKLNPVEQETLRIKLEKAISEAEIVEDEDKQD